MQGTAAVYIHADLCLGCTQFSLLRSSFSQIRTYRFVVGCPMCSELVLKKKKIRNKSHGNNFGNNYVTLHSHFIHLRGC